MSFEDLEQKLIKSIDQANFAQPEFEQKLGFLDKSLIFQGVGGALQGTVEGLISKFVPMSLPVGVASIVAGTVASKFAKGGIAGDLARGVVVGGISTLVSSLIGGRFMQAEKQAIPQVASSKYDGVIF